MTPEESLELLQEAHREPLAEAHFAAVRARVMDEITAGGRAARRGWWFAFAGLAAAVVIAGLWVKGPERRRVVPSQRVASLATKESRAGANTAIHVSHQTAASPRPTGRKPGGRPEGPAPPGIVGPKISQPLVVKMVTDDPDVVIYWITEGTGE